MKDCERDLQQILLKTTQMLAGDAMKCCRCGDELDLRDKYFLNGNGTIVLLLARVSSGLRLVLPAYTSPEGEVDTAPYKVSFLSDPSPITGNACQ